MSGEKVCPACSTQLPLDAAFCGGCGFRLAPVAAARRDAAPAPAQPTAKPAATSDDVAFAKTQAIPAAAAAMASASRSQPSGPPRQHVRFPLVVQVTVSSSHNFFRATTRNLSVGGLFVATDSPLPIGTRMQVTFTIPTYETPCVAECEVRWINDGSTGNSPHPTGMGLQFVNLNADIQDAMQLFVEHREPFVVQET